MGQIDADLAAAVAAVLRLGRADRIGVVGLLLAEVLVIDGHRDDASKVPSLDRGYVVPRSQSVL